MKNKKSFASAAVVFLVVGLLIGFWSGSAWSKQAGRTAAEKQLMPLVNLAFPKPPADIRSLTGAVNSVYGATINLEIDDPADYLPHLDGAPRATQTRFANVTPDTKFVVVSGGQVTTKPFSLSDLKPSDIITVRSGSNIREAQKFDVMEIDVVK